MEISCDEIKEKMIFNVFLKALSCKFEPGDGTGSGEKKIGMQTDEECIQACIRYKKTKDDRVNGVTILQVCSFLSNSRRNDAIITFFGEIKKSDEISKN